MPQIPVVDPLPEVRTGLLQGCRLVQREDRLRREVVEQTVHLAIEIGSAPFGVSGDWRERIGGGVRFQIFTGGQDHGPVHFGRGFLCSRIEQSERFHCFAQELDAQWFRICRRKDVHDPAANAEFTRDFNDGHPAIAEPEKASRQHFAFNAGSHLELQHCVLERVHRHEPLHDGLDGGHHLGGRHRSNLVQGVHPAGDQPNEGPSIRKGGFPTEERVREP